LAVVNIIAGIRFIIMLRIYSRRVKIYMVQNLSPLETVVIAWLLFGVRLNAVQFFCMLIVIWGVIVAQKFGRNRVQIAERKNSQ
jgi:drug/metabolite transporter (DMT)-like permease